MADIKNAFSKGLTVLNVKTTNFLEINKIKTYINTLNTEIAALKAEIGEIAFQSWQANGELEAALLEEKFQTIQAKLQQIQEQEEEAARLTEKEQQILGEQEAKQQNESAAAVRAASPAAPADTAEAVFSCPGCGQTYEQVFKFCRKCGTRMN